MSSASMALRPLSASLLAAAGAPLRAPLAQLPLLRRRLHEPLLQPLRVPFALTAIASIPSLLGDIWESILRAVPKKKTSHMKKRHRQMAGKALKDLTEITRCSACGREKRAHLLCPYCVQSILKFWKGKHEATKASNESSVDLAADTKGAGAGADAKA